MHFNSPIEGYLCFSHVSHEYDPDELIKIDEWTKICERNNQITGFVHYAHPNFVLYVEGNSNNVNQIMQWVMEDDRLKLIHHFNDRQKLRRRFQGFRMQNISPYPFPDPDAESTVNIILSSLTKTLQDLINPTGELQQKLFISIDKLSEMARE